MSRLMVAGLWGVFAGLNGYSALEGILEHINAKALVLQAQLSHTPEITEQAFRAANKAAENIVLSGDYFLGPAHAAVAVLCGGIAVYYTFKTEK